MDRPITVDPCLERDVNALMVCAPLQCSRQISCFRVARFARDRIRELHAEHANQLALADAETDCDCYSVDRLYQETGAWETA